MNFSWGKKKKKWRREQRRRFNQSKFPISQCHSAIHRAGPHVQRENLSAPPPSERLFCLLALIYISHCSWRGRAVAGKYLTLTARRFTFPKKKRKKKKRSQLSAADGFNFNGKKKKKRLLLPPKNNRQTLFCSALLSSLKCLIHVYTY